jgi:hypothetical protein
MAAGLNGLAQAGDVCHAVVFLSEEVKGCPVVPEVIALLRLPCRNVSNDPFNFIGSTAKTGLGDCYGCFGKVEHGDGLKARRHQIDETRSAPSNINDGRAGSCTCERHQLQRRGCVLLKPANFAFAFGGVDMLPMLLMARVVHGFLSCSARMQNQSECGTLDPRRITPFC